MATTQFLIRNRHCNVWYGRIVIPLRIREYFNGKRELRKSLGTSDRKVAKRRALEFWIECQNGFDRIDETLETSFANTAQFKLKRDKQGRLGKGFSNWFSRFEPRKGGKTALGYIERRGVESKGTSDGQKWTKTFHSFRHAAIDNLRDNKKLPNGEYILETHIGIVMGHTKDKLETAQYGQNRSQLELRKDVIEAINFGNVDFEEIRWKPM